MDKVTFYTNLHSDFIPQTKSGASYTRNYLMHQADTELIQFFDDDNGFDATYLERALAYYDHLTKQEQGEVVVCSTVLYRDTHQIQNQGFSHFSYRQSRPKRCSMGEKPSVEIQMFSGNGLLGKAQLFQSVLYDEEIAWIAEDLDFTLSLHEK